ncbi:transcriptional activator protein CzcR [Arthrobacter sp. Hiyo8]|nr:transcriptional activator protein CzcR [Arthrobacter sp. Hiyo8]
MRILLVEDEKMLAETLRRGLSNEGFVVDVTHDGSAGCGLPRKTPTT